MLRVFNPAIPLLLSLSFLVDRLLENNLSNTKASPRYYDLHNRRL